jgi:hypothetical protein
LRNFFAASCRSISGTEERRWAVGRAVALRASEGPKNRQNEKRSFRPAKRNVSQGVSQVIEIIMSVESNVAVLFVFNGLTAVSFRHFRGLVCFH